MKAEPHKPLSQNQTHQSDETNSNNRLALTNPPTSNKSKRGFASMPKDQVRAIARKGGEASHSGLGKKNLNRTNASSKKNDLGSKTTHQGKQESPQAITPKSGQEEGQVS